VVDLQQLSGGKVSGDIVLRIILTQLSKEAESRGVQIRFTSGRGLEDISVVARDMLTGELITIMVRVFLC
jgi:hypothetical protein